MAALAHVSARTIADYVRKGLLTAPVFRGSATRYTREHLLRLLAVRPLKAVGDGSMRDVKLRLDAMGSQELERWVLSREPEPAVLLALNVAPQTASSAAVGAGSSSAAGGLLNAVGAAQRAPLEVWRRVQLMPGLELSLREDAAVVVQQVAAHVYTHLERLILDALQATKPGAAVSGNE